MKRMLIIGLLLASAAFGETVYVTASGKTYHKATTCGILARSAKVLQAEKSVAEQHELKPCRSCYSAKKSNNSAWATEKK